MSAIFDAKPYHDLQLEPAEPENVPIQTAIRNYLLFTRIEERMYAAVQTSYLTTAMRYFAKLDLDIPITILDEESFERLYNRFLEIRTDREIASIQEQTGGVEEEEEFSLTEFLRTSSDILSSEESAPIIKFVNALFYQAVKRKASDIHIETHEHHGEVRFRIDGVLTKNVELERKVCNLVISRIKVVSNLDISENRIPQDGRTQIKIAGKVLDVRVSVLPTYYGERVVMRILMQSEQIPELEELGFGHEMTEQFKETLKHAHGIILVTGPTGSGKSTTLHAFLQHIADPQKNIITVEDPVEYKAENINQIQVNEKVGLTFASALRSILRQDPDVVMIGEIRDEETAQIAIRAALTGHLVLSTLHTNNATATIARLSDMGVEPFLLSSSILGILSQRLVRLLCSHCKQEYAITPELAEEFSFPAGIKLYKANGCRHCGYTGYAGRRPIGEFLPLTDELKRFLKESTDDREIRKYAKKLGLQTISGALKGLVERGETSLEEAVRIGLKDE